MHGHYHRNNGTAAKLLIDAGANVNARNANSVTSLAMAASLGHCSVISTLLDCPDTDINCQVLKKSIYNLPFLILLQCALFGTD